MQIKSTVFNRRTNYFLFVFVSLLIFLGIAAQNIPAAPADIDFSFGSKIIDAASVKKSIVQPDGKILLAGGFDVIVSQPQKYMIRLNTDGTRDASFSAAAPGQIDDFVLQPDGKIVVVGRFFYGFSNCNGFNQCYGIMRLNANGSYDTTFASGITPNGSQFVNTVALQPDGKFIIGGQFNIYGGQTRGLVARINSNGSLDTTFQNPNVNDGAFGFRVDALALQTDGKIIIGGEFDMVSGQPRKDVARLNTDGTLDAAFQGPAISEPGFIGVSTMAIQTDGKILVGGSFTQIGGQTRPIARLNADGSFDSTFLNASFVGISFGSPTVASLILQADGKIYVAGSFSSISGTNRASRARLNANGTLDTTFNLDGIRDIYSIILQASGRLLVIGTFTSPINNDTSIDYFIVREIDLDNEANAITVQPDGKILIGGVFTSVTGKARKGLARLNSDGTLDATFPNDNITFAGDASVNGVRKIVVQPDGKIIITGGFSVVAAKARINIARLNSDGSIDTTFLQPGSNPFSASDFLTDVVLQTDGKIIIGGSFTTVGGTSHNAIVRLNTDGTLDATFQNPLSSGFGVRSLAVQTDGKIIVGGNFPIGNQVNRGIVRLNANGSLDNTLQNTPVNDTQANNGNVNDIRIQTDGKILIGGTFSSVGGLTRKYLARLNIDGSVDTTFQDSVFTGSAGIYKMALQADGKIVVTGSFFTVGGQTRNGLARINADGSIDATFGDAAATTTGYNSHALAIQRDGKILLGGGFQIVSRRVQPWITRLLGTPIFVPRNSEYDFDGDGKADFSVFRSGMWFINPSTAPQSYYGVQFGLATDQLAPADYDGDGKADVAVWRESEGNFYILNSANGTVRIENFGLAGDILTVGDWDGDGKADFSVYREGAQSYFYYRGSLNNPSGNITYLPWGTTGDKAVRGDFDGDNKFDTAVYRASNQTWYIRNSSNGQTVYTTFGLATDKRISGDFDGDGKTDIAVFRDGLWIVLQSSNNQIRYQNWGATNDSLVAADYDGDGKTDFAVWRNGIYYVLNSGNSQIIYQNFGMIGDKTVASAYIQ